MSDTLYFRLAPSQKTTSFKAAADGYLRLRLHVGFPFRRRYPKLLFVQKWDTWGKLCAEIASQIEQDLLVCADESDIRIFRALLEPDDWSAEGYKESFLELRCSFDDEDLLEDKGLQNYDDIYAVCSEVAWIRREQVMVNGESAFDGGDDTVHTDESEIMLSAENSGSFGQLDMFSSPLDLGRLGVGWCLFFLFTRELAMLSVVLLLCQIPAIISYASQAKHKLDAWQTNQTNQTGTIPFYYCSAGNAGPVAAGEGTSDLGPVVSWIFSSLALLLWYFISESKSKSSNHRVDRNNCEPDDFALYVRGLPEDATENEVKTFIKDYARKGESGEKLETEVVKVLIGYDVRKFLDLEKSVIMADRASWHQCKMRMYSYEQDDETPSSSRTLKDSEASYEDKCILESRSRLEEYLECTGTAVVILQNSAHLRQTLAHWEGLGSLNKRRLVALVRRRMSCIFCVRGRFPQFRDKRGENHELSIARAANPSDIIWENAGQRPHTKWLNFGFTALASILVCIMSLLITSLFLRRYMEAAKTLESHGAIVRTKLKALMVNIVSLVCTVIASAIIYQCVLMERNKTRSLQDVRVMIYTTLTFVFIYAVVVRVGSLNSDTWYTSDIALVHVILQFFTVGVFTDPLCLLLSLKTVLRCLFCKFVGASFAVNHLCFTPTTYMQMFLPVEVDIATVYAYVMNTFISGIIFLPMFPLVMPLVTLTLCAQYAAVKFNLVHMSRRPYKAGAALAGSSRLMVFLSCAVCLPTFTWNFLSPSLTGLSSWIVKVLWIPMIVIFVLLSALGFCLSYVLGTQSTDEEDDYYVSETQWKGKNRYHITHPVYAHFRSLEERAGRAHGSVAEFDYKTGNLPTPKGVGGRDFFVECDGNSNAKFIALDDHISSEESTSEDE